MSKLFLHRISHLITNCILKHAYYGSWSDLNPSYNNDDLFYLWLNFCSAFVNILMSLKPHDFIRGVSQMVD